MSTLLWIFILGLIAYVLYCIFQIYIQNSIEKKLKGDGNDKEFGISFIEDSEHVKKKNQEVGQKGLRNRSNQVYNGIGHSGIKHNGNGNSEFGSKEFGNNEFNDQELLNEDIRNEELLNEEENVEVGYESD